MIRFDSWDKVPKSLWVWPNFTPAEMACKGTGRIVVVPDFMDRLQALRVVIGRPLRIMSGYRSPEHNAKVSSTGLTGPHTFGRAVDITIAGPDVYRLIKEAIRLEFTGIGISQKGSWDTRFIHVDDLTEELTEGLHPRPRVWSY